MRSSFPARRPEEAWEGKQGLLTKRQVHLHPRLAALRVEEQQQREQYRLIGRCARLLVPASQAGKRRVEERLRVRLPIDARRTGVVDERKPPDPPARNGEASVRAPRRCVPGFLEVLKSGRRRQKEERTDISRLRLQHQCTYMQQILDLKSNESLQCKFS